MYLRGLDNLLAYFWRHNILLPASESEAQVFIWVKADIKSWKSYCPLSYSSLAEQLSWPCSFTYGRRLRGNYWKVIGEMKVLTCSGIWVVKNHFRSRANHVPYVEVFLERCQPTSWDSWTAGEYLYFLNWFDHIVYAWCPLDPQGLLHIQGDLCFLSS